MPWVKIDDAFNDHPRIAQIGPLGVALWLAGLAYCNRNLTDGFIPEAKARTLIDWSQTDASGERWEIGLVSMGELAGGGYTVDSELVIDGLIRAGAWEDAPYGFSVHDYLDFQPSREQVEAERRGSADRQKAWRDRKRDSKARNGASNAVTNGRVTDAPVPVPVPRRGTPPNPPDIEGVWNAYAAHHPTAKLTKERRALIQRRLGDWPAETLIAAIEGNHRSPYHCGDNAEGKKYHDLGLILRSADKIETFAETATTPLVKLGRTALVPRPLGDCDECGGQGYVLVEGADGEYPQPCPACQVAA